MRPGAQRPRPVHAELRDARGVRAVLTFEDYTEVDGVAFPRRVRVEIERDGIDLVVRYREITLDPELPEDVFDQTPNAGLPVIEVDCAANALPRTPAAAPTADAGALDKGAARLRGVEKAWVAAQVAAAPARALVERGR